MEPKTISFNSNGGSSVSSQNLYKHQQVEKPKDPVREGFSFIAWYRDDGTFLEEYDFDHVPKNSFTLHANWLEDEVNQVTAIEIYQQPFKTEYMQDEALDLTGLIVILTYEDGTTEEVASDAFASKNISTSPASGTLLSVSAHDGIAVIISINGRPELFCETQILTVSKAPGADLTFTVTVQAISDVSATVNGNTVQSNGTVNSGHVLRRSTPSSTGLVTVEPPTGYTVEFRYDGAVIGTAGSSSITLAVSGNPADAAYLNPYNVIGSHYITVVLTSAQGVPFSFRISFEVQQ